MRRMAGVGISDYYRGHEGIRTLYADLDEAFDDWRWTIRGVIDGGDRLAVRADFVGYGRTSGAVTAVESGATAVKFSDRGLIAWQEWFIEQDAWRRALDAVVCRSSRSGADIGRECSPVTGERTATRSVGVPSKTLSPPRR